MTDPEVEGSNTIEPAQTPAEGATHVRDAEQTRAHAPDVEFQPRDDTSVEETAVPADASAATTAAAPAAAAAPPAQPAAAGPPASGAAAHVVVVEEPGFTSFTRDNRVLRIAAAVVLLAIVLFWLAGIFIDYRARVVRQEAAAAAKTEAAKAVTATKEKPESRLESATPKPAAKGSVVLILSDGVNFRERASGSAKIIRTLKKGTRLTFIEQSGSWYHARASDGTAGWLWSNNDQFVKRQ